MLFVKCITLKIRFRIQRITKRQIKDIRLYEFLSQAFKIWNILLTCPVLNITVRFMEFNEQLGLKTRNVSVFALIAVESLFC